jgi:hypothetical protein
MTRTLFLDFFKTLILHLLCTLVYCNFYQGFFLFFFPPLLGLWLLICILLSLIHRVIHRRVVGHYLKDDLLAQLWLQPLAFLCGSMILTLGLFFLLDKMGHSGLPRQICQLPVESFSRFIYVYFLLIFSSATYLFVELVLLWSPRLKSHHFSKKTRSVGRQMLAFLGILLVGGLYYISSFRAENLVYLTAVLTSTIGRNWERTCKLFLQLPKTNSSLYLNSRYRLGKIHLHRFHRYDLALGYFQEVILEQNSPIRDDAIYQSILCLLQNQGDSQTIETFLRQAKLGKSCLRDEIYFMLAEKFEEEEQWARAKDIYEQLSQESAYRFTLLSYFNSPNKQVFRTIVLARKKLNVLESFR